MEIREHMKIVGNDGKQVGTVDRVEGERIKMTKHGNAAGHEGHHHYIDRGLVDSAEGDTVTLSVSADAVPVTEESGERFEHL